MLDRETSHCRAVENLLSKLRDRIGGVYRSHRDNLYIVESVDDDFNVKVRGVRRTNEGYYKTETVLTLKSTWDDGRLNNPLFHWRLINASGDSFVQD